MTSFTFPDTSKLVLTAGEVLYGDTDDWMSALAAEMGVQPGTISDWANARRAPSYDNIEHLQSLVSERMDQATVAHTRLGEALPSMLCPVPGCGGKLSVLYAPGQRIIQCAQPHFFREDSGPPFGPFGPKLFHLVASHEALPALETLWLAQIDRQEFGEFARRIPGLPTPFEAYLEHLDRRTAQWETRPNRRVIRVPVTITDVDRYCAAGRHCRARDLTALAHLKSERRL